MKKESTKHYHLFVGDEGKAVLTAIQAVCEDRNFNISDQCDEDAISYTVSVAPHGGLVEVRPTHRGSGSAGAIGLLNLLRILRETNTPPKPKFIEPQMTNGGWLSDETMVSKDGEHVDWYKFRVFKTGVQVVSDDSRHSIIGWIPRAEVEAFVDAFDELDNQ